MTDKEIIEKINGLKGFKNTTVGFNKDKNIYDIYVRCLLLEDDFLTKVATIKKIQVVKCDFGIFELIISKKDINSAIESFIKIFS